MPVTVAYEDRVVSLAAQPGEGTLWVAPDALASALGWELRPEGLCRGALCVPLPGARRAELVRPDGAVDLAALARLRGQAMAHDEEGRTWVFGASSEGRRATARSLVAPDFVLPDLEGRPHRLSDARGRKVVLASWASW
jgi:hypothetical protein